MMKLKRASASILFLTLLFSACGAAGESNNPTQQTSEPVQDVSAETAAETETEAD